MESVSETSKPLLHDAQPQVGTPRDDSVSPQEAATTATVSLQSPDDGSCNSDAKDGTANERVRPGSKTPDTAAGVSPATGADEQAAGNVLLDKALRLTEYVGRGSMLPLVQDKIRNNTRSVSMVATLYVVACLLAFSIVAFAFIRNDEMSHSIEFVLDPPSSVVIGDLWPSFVVRLTDSDGLPVEGARIELSVMSAIDGAKLPSPYSQAGQAVPCSHEAYAPNSLGVLGKLCVPQGDALMQPNATTDDVGAAYFDQVRLMYGLRTRYIVVARFVPPIDEQVRREARGAVPFVYAHRSIYVSRPEDLRVQYNPSGNPDFDVPPTLAVGSMLNLSYSVAYTTHDTTVTGHPEVVAAALETEVSGSSATICCFELPFATSFAVSPERTSATLQDTSQPFSATTHPGHAVVVANFAITWSNATVTVSKTDGTLTYSVNANVSGSVPFRGISASTSYIQMITFGQAVALPHRARVHSATGMNAISVSEPVNVTTEVDHSTLTAVFASPMVGNNDGSASIAEGAEFKVTFTLSRGHSPAARPVMCFLGLDWSAPSAGVSFSAVNTILQPKKLMRSVVEVDASGRGTLTSSISVNGEAGDYLLYGSCDGVPITTAYADRFEFHVPMVVNVLTSVGHVSIIDHWQGDTRPLRGLLNTPALAILDSTGRPIVGKRLQIVPNTTDALTKDAWVEPSYIAKESDRDGHVELTNFLINGARIDEDPVYNFSFLIVVDGRTFGGFTRSIQGRDASLPWLQCANVLLATPAVVVYIGDNAVNNQVLQVISFNQAMLPLGEAPVMMTLVDPPLGVNSLYRPVGRTGYNGVGIFPSRFEGDGLAGLSKPTFRKYRISCVVEDGDELLTVASAEATVVYRPRFGSASVVNSTEQALPGEPRIVTIQISDVLWDTVNTQSPLQIGISLLWFATQGTGTIPNPTTVVTSITSSQALGPNGTLNVDLRTIPSQFALKPGAKLAVVTVDDVRVDGSTALFPHTATIGSIDIVESAFRGVPITRFEGIPIGFTVQPEVANFTRPLRKPVVAVRDSAGTVMANNPAVRVFAEVGTHPWNNGVIPTLPEVEWHHQDAFPHSFLTAALCDGDQALQHGVYRPMAADGTDGNGLMTLPPLFFAGATTSKWVLVRYCASLPIAGSSEQADLNRTVCAAETVAIRFEPDLQLSIVTLDTFITGTPSRVAMNVQVLAPHANVEYQPAIRLLASDVASMKAVGAAAGTVMLPVEAFNEAMFSFPFGYSGRDGDEYPFQLYAGGAVLHMVYRATTSPTQLFVDDRVTQGPLQLDSFAALSSFAYPPGPALGVFAIPDVPCAVTVEVANATKAATCRAVFGECGVLATSSTLFAYTAGGTFVSGATANVLNVVFSSSPDQNYRITVHALKPRSAAGTTQLMSEASRGSLYGAYGTADAITLRDHLHQDWLAQTLVDLLDAPLPSTIAPGDDAVAAVLQYQPRVTNPVVDVKIVHEAPLSLKTLRLADASRIEDIPEIALGGSDAPIVRLLGVNGTAIAGVPASLFVVDAATGEHADSVAVIARGHYVSDENGIVSFDGVTLLPTKSGTFKFYINSRGSSGVLATTDISVDLDELNLAKSMKLAIAAVAVIFLPLSCVTVPYTRTSFSVFGLACLCAFAGLYFHELQSHWSDLRSSLGVAYFATLSTWVGVLFVISAVVSLLTVESAIMRRLVTKKPDSRAQRRSSPLKRLKQLLMLNGEERALDTFRYAQWITTANIRHQMLEDAQKREEEATAKRRDVIERGRFMTALHALNRIRVTVATWLNSGAADLQRLKNFERLNDVVEAVHVGGLQEAAGSRDEVSPRQRPLLKMSDSQSTASDGEEMQDMGSGQAVVNISTPSAGDGVGPLRPPLTRPAHVPSAAFVPLNVVIVISLSVAIIIVILIALVYGFRAAVQFLDQFVACLPNPSASTSKDVNEISNALVDVLTEGAALVPSLRFLAPAVGALRHVNVMQILGDVRDFLGLFRDSLATALVIAVVIAAVIVVLTLVFTLRGIEPLVMRARRGAFSRGVDLTVPSYAFLEGYVSLHTLHIAALFALCLVFMLIIAIALLVEPIRMFLFNALFYVVVFAALSTIAVMILQAAVMQFLLDSWLVVRPEWFALYSLIEFVLQAFKAPLSTITRWAEGLAFVSLCFGRFDEPLFPKPFNVLDKGASAFRSTVLLDARYNNPLFLTFASTLVLDRLLKRAAAARASVVPPRPTADADDIPQGYQPPEDASESEKRDEASPMKPKKARSRGRTVVALSGEHEASLTSPVLGGSAANHTADEDQDQPTSPRQRGATVLHELAPELSLALLSDPRAAMDRERELLRVVADDADYIATVHIDTFAAVPGLSGRVTALCRILMRWNHAVDPDLSTNPFHGWKSLAGQRLAGLVSRSDQQQKAEERGEDRVIRYESSSEEDSGVDVAHKRQARRLPYFDAAQYVRERQRRKVLLRWTLLLLLARNPSLRLFRKHRLAQLRQTHVLDQ